MTSKTKKRKLAYLLLSLLLITGMIVAALYFSKTDEQAKDKTPNGITTTSMPKGAIDSRDRGPQPKETRLGEGAKQIENPAEAVDLAKVALKRVEQELSEASDEKARLALTRKKEMIEQTISRLVGSE